MHVQASKCCNACIDTCICIDSYSSGTLKIYRYLVDTKYLDDTNLHEHMHLGLHTYSHD